MNPDKERSLIIILATSAIFVTLLCTVATDTFAHKNHDDSNVKTAQQDGNDDHSVDSKHDTITSEKQNDDGSTTVEITKVDANSPDDNNPTVDIPMIKDKNGNMQIDTEKTDDCFKCNAGVPPEPKAPKGADNPEVVTYEDGSQSWESVDKNGNRLIFDEKDGWITLNEKVSNDNSKSDSSSKSSGSSGSSSKSKSKNNEDPTSNYMIIPSNATLPEDKTFGVFKIMQVDNEVITKMHPIAQFENVNDARKFIETMESIN
jgi:hypothetical protein